MGRAHRRREGVRESRPAAPDLVARRHGPRSAWIVPLLLASIALLYAPSLSNGFTYDDPAVVADATDLLSHPRLSALVSGDYFRLSGESTYRPLVTLTYIVDWRVGHGAAWAFHLQSVCWHLIAVGSLLVLLGRIGATDGVRYTSAALFGVHPALVEAVDAVAFREDVLVTAFGLLGLVLATGNRPRWRAGRLALAVLAFAAALLSKESGVVFLALVPLTLWAAAERRAAGSWRPTAHWPEYISLVAITGAYLVVRFVLLPAHEDYGNRVGDSLAASLATGAVAFGYYLKLLLYPFALCADYRGVVAIVSSAADWRIWFSLVLLGALSAIAWRSRKEQPLMAWGWAWFLVSLGPVSNVVPIPTFMAERFLYLPFVGLTVFAVLLVERLAVARVPQPQGILAITLVALIALSVATWRRHAAWASNEVLWQTTLRDFPTAQGAVHGYGSVLIAQGRYADGIAYLTRLLEDPTIGRDRRAAVRLELGFAYDRLGLLDLARQSFEQAIAAAPAPQARAGLALTYLKLDRMDEAKLQLDELLRAQPDDADGYSLLGAVFSRQGRSDDALAAWSEAVRLDPAIGSAHANIGVTLGNQGRLDEGIAALERALALEPGQAPWHVAIARLLAERGDRTSAIGHLEEALRIDPSFEPAREALEALTKQ